MYDRVLLLLNPEGVNNVAAELHGDDILGRNATP